jgi:3-oxoacyl-[acyl-carrier protein] reductase
MSGEVDMTVVSGGGTGIGRAVALRVAALGTPVLVVGRRPKPLDETAGLSREHTIEPVVADVSTTKGALTVVDALRGRRVVGVVAAAGGQGDFKNPGPSLPEVERAWDDALRKNLFSALLLVEALVPHLRDQLGRVVLIRSTSSVDGRGGPYATAKAAVNGYGRELAHRLGGRGITVNTVAPGFVADTEFYEAGGYDLNERMVNAAAAATLVKRVGTRDEVAGCVCWLLSPDGGWTTGQVISPNGGTVFTR